MELGEQKNKAGKVENKAGKVKNKAGKGILGLSWRWLNGFNGTLHSQREILRGWVEIPSWQLQGDSSKEYLDSPYLSKLSPKGEKKMSVSEQFNGITVQAAAVAEKPPVKW